MTDTRRTRPLSQVEIEVEIAETMDLLEQATEDFETHRIEAAKADSAYRRAYAYEVLRCVGKTVSEREARASVNTADAYEIRRITEATAETTKGYMQSLRDRLSALQSLLRSIHAQT